MPIFRRVCFLLSASLALHGIITVLPSLMVLDAASNTRFLAAAPGGFVAISARYQQGLLKDRRSEVQIEFKGADGAVASMTAIEPPRDSSADIFAAIPPHAALGRAGITVTAPGYRGEMYIDISRAAPAIFTKSHTGFGPALATHRDASSLTLLSPAAPEEEVTLYATGLGGATGSEVTVEIGGVPAHLLYAGPQGLAGLDQINLSVPRNAQPGCYVPVVVRSRGVASGFVTIPIGTCTHPLGLTPAEVESLESGGSIPVAYFRVGESRIQRNDTAALWTMRMDARASFPNSGLTAPDSVFFSCQGAPQYNGAYGSSDGQDDAGALNLFAPNGEVVPMPRNSGAPYAILPRILPSGTWQLSAAGGEAIRGFSQAFRIPPPLKNLRRESQGQDQVVTWDTAGFLPTDTVTIGPCRSRATDGRLVIPNAAQIDYVAFLRPHPSARTIFPLERIDGRTMPAIIDYDFYFQIPRSAVQ